MCAIASERRSSSRSWRVVEWVLRSSSNWISWMKTFTFFKTKKKHAESTNTMWIWWCSCGHFFWLWDYNMKISHKVGLCSIRLIRTVPCHQLRCNNHYTHCNICWPKQVIDRHHAFNIGILKQRDVHTFCLGIPHENGFHTLLTQMTVYRRTKQEQNLLLKYINVSHLTCDSNSLTFLSSIKTLLLASSRSYCIFSLSAVRSCSACINSLFLASKSLTCGTKRRNHNIDCLTDAYWNIHYCEIYFDLNRENCLCCHKIEWQLLSK